MIHNHETIQG